MLQTSTHTEIGTVIGAIFANDLVFVRSYNCVQNPGSRCSNIARILSLFLYTGLEIQQSAPLNYRALTENDHGTVP